MTSKSSNAEIPDQYLTRLFRVAVVEALFHTFQSKDSEKLREQQNFRGFTQPLDQYQEGFSPGNGEGHPEGLLLPEDGDGLHDLAEHEVTRGRLDWVRLGKLRRERLAPQQVRAARGQVDLREEIRILMLFGTSV